MTSGPNGRRRITSSCLSRRLRGRKGRRMYNVAVVTDEKCVSKEGCCLCIMYCPEADWILLDAKNMVAKVVTDICKGCELCRDVCDAAKDQAIEMLAMGADGTLVH